MEKERKKLGLVHNILYSGAGSIIFTLCQWLTTIIIIRLLGYEASGFYALAITVTNTFFSISLWGIRSFQIADINDSYSYSDYFYNRILTNVIAFLIFIGFMLVNNYSLDKIIIIVLYMLYKVIDSFFDFFDTLCQKQMRMDVISKSMIFRSIISIALFTGVCYFYKSLEMGIIIMIITSLIYLLFYNYRFCKKEWKFKYVFDKNKIIKLLLTCTPLMLSGFLVSLNLMIPKYLYEKFFDTEMLGIFTTITSLALVVQLGAQTILAPMLPVLAEYYKNGDQKSFANIIYRFCILSFCILIIAFLGVKFLGPWVIGIIYGADLVSYTYLLYLAIFSSFLTIISWVVCYLLTLLKRTKIQLTISLISAIVCMIVSYPVLSSVGLNGINIVIIIAQCCSLVIMVMTLVMLIFKHH